MIRLATLLLLFASPAAAHGTLPGAGGFISGMAHPFLAADHLLLLIALGALLGRDHSRRPLIPLLAGLIAGFALTLLQLGPLQPAILTAALFLGLALATAIHTRGPLTLTAATITGLLIGADTDGPSGPAAIIAYAGVTTTVFLITLNSMALATLGGHYLNAVPLRIAGSWIAAAAILILAFLARNTLGLPS